MEHTDSTYALYEVDDQNYVDADLELIDAWRASLEFELLPLLVQDKVNARAEGRN